MAGFTIKRILRVPPGELWEQLSNFKGSDVPGMEIVMEHPGDPVNHQVGAIRRIIRGSELFREKLLDIDPVKRCMTYKLLSGAPVKNYRGTVAVEDVGRYSLVTWRVRFVPVFPWPAALLAGYARRSINNILDDAESYLGRQLQVRC